MFLLLFLVNGVNIIGLFHSHVCKVCDKPSLALVLCSKRNGLKSVNKVLFRVYFGRLFTSVEISETEIRTCLQATGTRHFGIVL